MKVESLRSTVAGACQQKTSKATWPPVALCGACGWAVVQLDYDVEMGPLHGMYGSMEAECEAQRTIKRAQLTAFLCLLRKVSGPNKVHVDNEGTIGVSRQGEKRVYQAWSRRCRLVDTILGRVT